VSHNSARVILFLPNLDCFRHLPNVECHRSLSIAARSELPPLRIFPAVHFHRELSERADRKPQSGIRPEPDLPVIVRVLRVQSPAVFGLEQSGVGHDERSLDFQLSEACWKFGQRTCAE